MIKLSEQYSWIDLNPQFEKALSLIKNTNDNLNILGSAGVGKSLLLKLIAHDDTFIKGNKVILSSTGISAANISTEGIKGSTIHSFFKFPAYTIYSPSMVNIKAEMFDLINNLDVIIIDEISMVNCSLMDFLFETILMYRSKQFKQMPRFIFFGDVLQLPPVIKRDAETIKYFHELYNDKFFYFNSYSYKDLGFTTIHLDTIYRQKDSSFQNILNRIRQGLQTDEDLRIVNERVMPEEQFFDEHNGIYTYLASKNETVKIINKSALDTLPGFSTKYFSKKFGNFNSKYRPFLQDVVELKKGLPIMCIKNASDLSFQNGMLGIVENLFHDRVIMRTKSGKCISLGRGLWEEFTYKYDSLTKKVLVENVGKFEQIIVTPASAQTYWKAQGQTLTAYMDTENIFENSLIYIGLSRTPSLLDLGLKKKIEHKDIKIAEEALEFLNKEG